MTATRCDACGASSTSVRLQQAVEFTLCPDCLQALIESSERQAGWDPNP